MKKTAQKSVAKLVSEMVQRKPFVLKAMEDGYCNESALARILHAELSAGRRISVESVRAALKRLVLKRPRGQEDKITALLSKSKLSLITKISVLVVEPMRVNENRLRAFEDSIAVVKSSSGITVLANDEHFRELRRRFSSVDILVEGNSLVALVLTSPTTLENTSGVVAFITGRLAADGINIREFYSSYTDTLFLLEQRDALRAFALLEKFTRSG